MPWGKLSNSDMKTLLCFCAILIATLIAPISAVASEEARASYVAIQYTGIPDRLIAKVVITADAAFADSWKPYPGNGGIYLFVRAYLLDGEAYTKVHDFFVREAAKKNGKKSSLDNYKWGSYEISGRTVSGKVNPKGNGSNLNALGWSLDDDMRNFSVPLTAKESSEVLKAFVGYLTEQGIDAGLQKELAGWR
jgi:hypothetical protein